MNIEVNYLAVLIAAVGQFGVGFLWYTFLFRDPWMKELGISKASITPEKMKGVWKNYLTSFVLGLVGAYVLAHVMALSQYFYDYPALTTGLTSAFWSWLGFVMPVQLTDVLFGGRSFKLFLINTGYQLVGLLVMGAILGIMA